MEWEEREEEKELPACKGVVEGLFLFFIIYYYYY